MTFLCVAPRFCSSTLWVRLDARLIFGPVGQSLVLLDGVMQCTNARCYLWTPVRRDRRMDDKLPPHSEWKKSSAPHVMGHKTHTIFLFLFLFSLHTENACSVSADYFVTNRVVSHRKKKENLQVTQDLRTSYTQYSTIAKYSKPSLPLWSMNASIVTIKTHHTISLSI